MLIIAHSMGCLVVRNELKMLPEDIRKRISVLAIAPAGYIDPETCRDVRHYVSNDFVAKLDKWGAKEYAHTITYLPPGNDANKFFNHTILSPTYKKPIRDNSFHYL